MKNNSNNKNNNIYDDYYSVTQHKGGQGGHCPPPPRPKISPHAGKVVRAGTAGWPSRMGYRRINPMTLEKFLVKAYKIIMVIHESSAYPTWLILRS